MTDIPAVSWAAPAPVPGVCGECGSADLTWDLTTMTASNSGPANGAPLARDIRPALLLGCDTCSATVYVAYSAQEAGL